jgi:hypothetical protein
MASTPVAVGGRSTNSTSGRVVTRPTPSAAGVTRLFDGLRPALDHPLGAPSLVKVRSRLRPVRNVWTGARDGNSPRRRQARRAGFPPPRSGLDALLLGRTFSSGGRTATGVSCAPALGRSFFVQRRRSQSGAEQSSAERLLGEIEAFLEGRHVEYRQRTGLRIPTWARLNWLTHSPASALVIRVSACRVDPSRMTHGSWEWAEALLAAEAVTLAGGDPEVVTELQHDCFVPLELALMGPAYHDVLPADLVALSIARLRAHPQVRDRGVRDSIPPGVRRIDGSTVQRSDTGARNRDTGTVREDEQYDD